MTAVEHEPGRPDPAFRCSPWTRAQGVDPIGSSARFDALILVEWPLPWPKDVSEIPALAAASAVPGLRVMAVVPRPDEGGDGRLRVVHRRRTRSNHLAGTDHRVPMADVAALLATLAADPLADSAPLSSTVGESPPEVLVCAHGRRDACCGRWGTLMHLELAARWDGVRVWRCSHTGGHRFAPTAITLPEGRAWAYVDPDLLDDVVHRRGDLRAILTHDRGNSAHDQWAQVVERALFEEHGWAWLDDDVTDVRSDVAADGRSATVTLRAAGRTVTGSVEVERMVPVLVCGAPPDQARKSSPDLRLRHLLAGPERDGRQ